MIRSIAAVGDVTDPACWSGTPYHFWKAAASAGFATKAWRVDLARVRTDRLLWNAAQAMRFRQPGGFQYSSRFLDLIESRLPTTDWTEEIITMNQHFPRATSVEKHGGRLDYYLDAPFSALAAGRGLAVELPRRVVEKAILLERANYAGSNRIVTMARWAADAIRSETGVASEKVHVILPGANLELPPEWTFPPKQGSAGRDRDFTLGFIGKDWQRKGLPLILDVRDELERRGWRTRVLAAGGAPTDLIGRKGLEFAGYIDKKTDPGGFLAFLSRCDVGCLFSGQEALGISILEFLRAGIPVAGFDHEGMADTIPPDAGFRFTREASASEIADRFDDYLKNEGRQADFIASAQGYSPLVSWDRCLREFKELWETGTVAYPLKLWEGTP